MADPKVNVSCQEKPRLSDIGLVLLQDADLGGAPDVRRTLHEQT
jgi:hypothetical protein